MKMIMLLYSNISVNISNISNISISANESSKHTTKPTRTMMIQHKQQQQAAQEQAQEQEQAHRQEEQLLSKVSKD